MIETAPASEIRELAAMLTDAIAERIVGQAAVVELLLAAVMCDGHVLIEDVPGTGKTALAKALAAALGVRFRRIQFTPDLLPSDLTGSSIFNQRTQDFEFRPGPLFGQIILADEINRATPRTQSALLEAMEERQITMDGATMPLDRPFLVIATQNPVELDGTFPLPEAQLDRFLLQLELGYPELEVEREVVLRNCLEPKGESTHQRKVLGAEGLERLQRVAAEVHVSRAVHTYMLNLVRATRQLGGVELGASPRASIALFRCCRALACLRGRDYVLPDDVKYLAPFVLAHRLILSPEARAAAHEPAALLAKVLERVSVPVEEDAQVGSADA
jgi:MoxR-like ATPase